MLQALDSEEGGHPLAGLKPADTAYVRHIMKEAILVTDMGVQTSKEKDKLNKRQEFQKALRASIGCFAASHLQSQLFARS